MAWVDEWWKGRVIDAVDADERNAMLGVQQQTAAHCSSRSRLHPAITSRHRRRHHRRRHHRRLRPTHTPSLSFHLSFAFTGPLCPDALAERQSPCRYWASLSRIGSSMRNGSVSKSKAASSGSGVQQQLSPLSLPSSPPSPPLLTPLPPLLSPPHLLLPSFRPVPRQAGVRKQCRSDRAEGGVVSIKRYGMVVSE